MHKYHYKGEHEVELVGYGLVQKGETIETNLEINHPNFELADGNAHKEFKRQIQEEKHEEPKEEQKEE